MVRVNSFSVLCRVSRSVWSRGAACRPLVMSSLPCTSLALLGRLSVPPVGLFHTSSSQSSSLSPAPKLMEFPHIVTPSLFKLMRNFVLVNLIIRPYMDSEFTFDGFLQGAKQALLVISDKLANNQLPDLEKLVTPEAFREIQRNYPAFSEQKKHQLAVDPSHFGIVFPYEIGLMLDGRGEYQKRWVEITVCAHVHPNFAKEHFGGVSALELPDLLVYNLRFIRNYTKGVQDTWTVNIVSRFYPNQKS